MKVARDPSSCKLNNKEENNMLAINIDDVLNVLTTVAPYLIGFGIVLVIAIIAMIACKKQSKAKKYMVRS